MFRDWNCALLVVISVRVVTDQFLSVAIAIEGISIATENAEDQASERARVERLRGIKAPVVVLVITRVVKQRIERACKK